MTEKELKKSTGSKLNITIKFLALVLYLIAVMICFTILAIVFNNWWLILLSILFLTVKVNIKEKETKDD